MAVLRSYFKLLCFIFFFTCIIISTPIFAGTREPITITKVDYTIENIHPSYWDQELNLNEPRLHYNFYIYIDNLKQNLHRIKQVQVENMYESTWTINLKKYVNLKEGYIGGLGRWYDDEISNNGTLLSITDLKVIITTTDNQTIEQPFSIPEPGALEASTIKFVYCENYRGKITNAHAPALKLGVINSVEYNNNTFEFNFTVNDKRVANGLFIFYDKKKNYVGETGSFVNAVSGEILESLNDGKEFYVDEKSNLLKLNDSQIYYDKNRHLSDIQYIQLKLWDGIQFANTKKPDNYIYVSRSELYPFK